LTFAVALQRPQRDVDVMCAPVGELAAGVFVPPAEVAVTALVSIVDERRLSEPAFPVELAGGIVLFEGSAAVAAVDAHSDSLHVADQSLLDHVDRPQEAFTVAAQLRANEEHLVGVPAAGAADELIFLERERERLLAENALACFEGFDGDLHVPVI